MKVKNIIQKLNSSMIFKTRSMPMSRLLFLREINVTRKISDMRRLITARVMFT